MTRPIRFLAAAFCLLPTASFSLHAAAPPELTILRQQYEKQLSEAVTAPFAAEKSALDTKFTAAIDRAAGEAKQAGKLDDVLALMDDKKRLANGLPLPDDSDSTAEVLKPLRAIYREQAAKIEDQRATALAGLLPAFAAKLQELEITLTRADRIDEAKEIKDYRESLSTGIPQAATPATVIAMPPAAPAAAPASPPASIPPPKGRGDDRAAAEWVLANGGSVSIKGSGAEVLVKTAADLPAGRFAVVKILVDGRNAPAPVTAEALGILSDLPELLDLNLDYLDLPDEDLTFVATLPKLAILQISHNPSFTGSLARHLTGLRSLEQIIVSTSSLTDDAVAALGQCPSLKRLIAGQVPLTDACIPHLNQWKNLEALNLSLSQVTPAGLAQLRHKVTTLGFNLAPGSPLTPVAELIAPYQPDVTRVMLGYTLHDDAISALKVFPKLTHIELGGIAGPAVLDGLPAVPGIVDFSCGATLPITDADLLKFVPMKRLKKLSIRNDQITAAGVAAFKKERPDVAVFVPGISGGAAE